MGFTPRQQKLIHFSRPMVSKHPWLYRVDCVFQDLGHHPSGCVESRVHVVNQLQYDESLSHLGLVCNVSRPNYCDMCVCSLCILYFSHACLILSCFWCRTVALALSCHFARFQIWACSAFYCRMLGLLLWYNNEMMMMMILCTDQSSIGLQDV